MRPSSASITGVGSSPWIPLDMYSDSGAADGLFTNITGTVSYGLDVTGDNIFDPTVTPVAHALGAPWSALTANSAGVLPFAARAVRANNTSGTGTVTLTVVTRGTQ